MKIYLMKLRWTLCKVYFQTSDTQKHSEKKSVPVIIEIDI